MPFESLEKLGSNVALANGGINNKLSDPTNFACCQDQHCEIVSQNTTIPPSQFQTVANACPRRTSSLKQVTKTVFSGFERHCFLSLGPDILTRFPESCQYMS